jgi:myo-inositol-1(or 4)-monophosphatase
MDILSIARALALETGAFLLERRRAPRTVTEKGRRDFATDVDVEAARRITARLRVTCPTHDVLCEDGADAPDRAPAGDHRWIVDPLDGTTNYIHGYPFYAVSLSCVDVDRGASVASVVYAPFLGQLFEAGPDAPPTMNGRPIRVSDVGDVGDCLVLTGMSHHVSVSDGQAESFIAASAATAGTRRSGCASLDLCYVAAGFAEVYYHYRLAPWDMAAGAHIVARAGGRVSNVGASTFASDGRTILASNGRCHDELQRLLRGVAAPSASFIAGGAAGGVYAS